MNADVAITPDIMMSIASSRMCKRSRGLRGFEDVVELASVDAVVSVSGCVRHKGDWEGKRLTSRVAFLQYKSASLSHRAVPVLIFGIPGPKTSCMPAGAAS